MAHRHSRALGGHRRGPALKLRTVAIAAAVAVAAGACSPAGGEEAAPPVGGRLSRPPVPAPPPGTPPPPVTPVAPPPVELAPVGLVPGTESDDVRRLQDRLVALRYDPGPVDGRYRATTVGAVMAFQKVSGLPRTGTADPATITALSRAADPVPLLPDGGATRVEVDFGRQVLFFYSAGVLSRILPVSTGNGKRYCAKGRCGVAVTPSGSFRIGRKLSGKRVSYLGTLYNPLYFKGGYAIHGSPSVPAQPASHGCVRIPIHSSRWLLAAVPAGTPVYLIGGRSPALPFPPEA